MKNLPVNTGDGHLRDAGSVPGSGRSPGGGNDNPLQYSCLENPRDRGTWGHKGSDATEVIAPMHPRVILLYSARGVLAAAGNGLQSGEGSKTETNGLPSFACGLWAPLISAHAFAPF